MINPEQLIELARRKERLIARAESQRMAVGTSFRELQAPIAIVDRGLAVGRFLRAHPVLVVALVGAVTVFRRRGLVSVAGRALTAWRLWRSLSAWTV